jgi:hypothetical protein
LAPKEVECAKEILDELCSGTKGALLKRVATDSAGRNVSYQIIHDAMAIPILGWVERLQNEERVRVETSKFRGRLLLVNLGVFGTALLLGIAFIAARTGPASRLDQMVNFTKLSPISSFRLPILLGLSSVDQANSQWWWLLDRRRAQTVLQEKLVHSPRFAGNFVATGIDVKGERVAWLSEDGGLSICNLSSFGECSGNPEIVPDLDAKSTTVTAAYSNRVKAIGFVQRLETPVVVSAGVIHFRDNGIWKTVDLADIVQREDLFWFVNCDVGGGVIKVISADWQRGKEVITPITFNYDNGSFERKAGQLRFDWEASNLVPVASATGEHAAALYAGN